MGEGFDYVCWEEASVVVCGVVRWWIASCVVCRRMGCEWWLRKEGGGGGGWKGRWSEGSYWSGGGEKKGRR